MPSFLDILMALNKSGMPPIPPPAQPVPGMLPMGNAPLPLPGMPQPTLTPPPPAPMPGLDQNLIAQLAGPAPVQQDPGLLEKIGAVLSGIGQGPQYGAQLREQQARPQREYQARKSAAVEIAEQKRQRQQELTQRRADQEFEREFQTRAQEMGFTQQREMALLQDAMLAKRQREDDERAAGEAEKNRKAQAVKDARQFKRDYRLAGAGKYADELGDRDAGLRDTVSKAADNWVSAQARLAARRAAGGGGAKDATSNMLVEIDVGGGQTSIIPFKDYVRIQGTVGPPKRIITGKEPTAAPGLTSEAVKQAIANPNANRATLPAQLRAVAKTPQEKAIVEAEIKLAGLDQPQIASPTGPDLRPQSQRNQELPVNQFIEGVKQRYQKQQTPEEQRRRAVEFQG